MRKYLHESELREIAEAQSHELYIRKEDDRGNSEDILRKATKSESKHLYNIIYGALLGLNWGETNRSDAHAEQAIIDTAEFTIDLLIPEINGYLSLYCPLKRILREWEQE